MTEIMERLTAQIGPVLVNVLGALAILVVGYIIARLLSALVHKALRKTTLDDRLANTLQKDEPRMELERPISRGVFWVVMVLVVVAVLQVLQLTFVTAPLNEFLQTIFGFLPQLIAAGVLVVVAYIVASILRLIVRKGLRAANVDERLVGAIEEEPPKMALSESVGTAVYYLIFLLFLPAILGTLNLQGLLRPVEGLLDEMLAFLPNIFAAAVILVIGYFIAKLIRNIVANLLAAVGADRLAERVGISGVLGTQKLSDVLGTIVYVLVLLPVLIAALNALSIDAVTGPASEMLDLILAAIPQILGAAVVLIIAYVIGKLVGGLVANILSGVGFNRFLSRIGLWNESNTADGHKSPSDLVGALVMVAILLFATIESANLLGFGTLTDLISEFMVFAGQVLLGLVIFGLGLYIAKLAHSAIESSGMSQATLIATAARVAIIVFVGAMALRQMGLANSIINLAFGIVLGAIALAAAIAFGIGGRDFAKRQLDRLEDGGSSA